MMDFIFDILSYGYLRNALIASLLSGIVCGIIGTYVVSRRSTFLAGGVTHSSFGGLGLALYMGADPIVGATIFAVASALGIEWATNHAKIREDSAVGIIWAVGMATGILFMSLRPGYTSGDLSNYLFGSIITVSNTDVISLLIFASLLVVGAMLWLRPVMLVAFDRDFARSQGVPTRFISYTMAALTAVAVVLSIRTMGIILLLSMLTLPVVIADTLCRSYRHIVLLAPLIGAIGGGLGLYVSYKFEVPPGAAIIFLLSFALIIVKIVTLWLEKRRVHSSLTNTL